MEKYEIIKSEKLWNPKFVSEQNVQEGQFVYNVSVNWKYSIANITCHI